MQSSAQRTKRPKYREKELNEIAQQVPELQHRRLPQRKKRRFPGYYSVEEIKSHQRDFMSRLTFITAACQPRIANFDPLLANDWRTITQVVYRTRWSLHCSVCLEVDMLAPQMIPCGHVFCWVCLLRHNQLSLKGSSCPVCNERFHIEDTVSCSVLPVTCSESSELKLSLKKRHRGCKKVFDVASNLEDIRFSHLVFMQPNALAYVLESELKNILASPLLDDKEMKPWMRKVIDLSEDRIEAFQRKKSLLKPVKLEANELVSESVILEIADKELKEEWHYFYETEGITYLHPLCMKSIQFSFKKGDLPQQLTGECLFREEIEYQKAESAIRWPGLGHLHNQQEVQLVWLEISQLLSSKEQLRYESILKSYKEDLQRKQTVEERRAKERSQRFQEEKQYIDELKQMQSLFFRIDVPNVIVDPAEIISFQSFPVMGTPNVTPVEQVVETPSELDSSVSSLPVDPQQFPSLSEESLPMKKTVSEVRKGKKSRKGKAVFQSYILPPEQFKDLIE